MRDYWHLRSLKIAVAMARGVLRRDHTTWETSQMIVRYASASAGCKDAMYNTNFPFSEDFPWRKDQHEKTEEEQEEEKELLDEVLDKLLKT